MSVHYSMLLVEDDSALLDRLSRRFTELGYSVTPVHHPRQALGAAATRRFDLALLEYALPEFDGNQLRSKLKSMLGDLQVILFAGHGARSTSVSEVLADEAEESPTPCSLDNLEAALDQALRERARCSLTQA